MELYGEHEFDVARDVVWENLFRPDLLEECIPGAESVERTSEEVFEGEVIRSLASISVTMSLVVEIDEDGRPDYVSAGIDGTDDRTNSQVTGLTFVEMEDQESGSILSYDADINVTGRVASLGSRLIKRQLTKDLSTFFERVEEQLETGA